MKIAIPTQGDYLNNHFGHCESFTLLEIGAGEQIITKETMTGSVECGCKSNLAGDLQQKGVTLLLAGGIGDGAIQKLKHHQIEVITGFSGTIEEVISKWQSKDFSNEMKICTDHQNCH